MEAQESGWPVGLGGAASREALKDGRKLAIWGARFGSGAWNELEAEGNEKGSFIRCTRVCETQEQPTLPFLGICS